MKKTIIILFLFISFVANAATYYIATTGNNSNPGTITQPFGTWQYAFNKLSAGDILYVRGGTYTGMLGVSGSRSFGVRVQGINGTSGSHITVSAYPGEVPILDGASLTSTTGSNVGIELYDCSYWDFIGLTVTSFLQYSDNIYPSSGWFERRVSHMTHTRCTVTNCGRGFVAQDGIDYIYFTNCDSYMNYDRYTDPSGALPGSLCDGFYCPLDAGTHVFFTGCRAWNNSDDGWDCFHSRGGYIVWTNCWSFENGQCGNMKGDGSGFKLGIINGPIESGIQRILKNCLSFGNLVGYDQNSGPNGTIVQMAIYNCTSASNKNVGFQFNYDDKAMIRNNISYNETVGDFGSSDKVDHNSWRNGLSVSSADFVSLTSTDAKGARGVDGSLPVITYLHIAVGSHLIDAGVNVGIPFNGIAPDLGAFEMQNDSTTSIPVYK